MRLVIVFTLVFSSATFVVSVSDVYLEMDRRITDTENKLEMRGKAQRVVRPAQTRLPNSGLLDQSSPIFFYQT